MNISTKPLLALPAMVLAFHQFAAGGAALWDVSKDKDSVVKAVEYNDAFLYTRETDYTGETLVQYEISSDTYHWGYKQTGQEFWDDCLKWNVPSVDRYIFNSYAWNSNGAGTVYSGNTTEVNGCGDTNVGETRSYLVPDPPSYFSAGARTRISPDYGQMHIETINRNGHTTYDLWTGGRAVPGRKSFFLLAAWAQRISDFFYPEVDAISALYDVDPHSIILGNVGRQNTGGWIIRAYGNGEVHDVTPTVPRAFSI